MNTFSGSVRLQPDPEGPPKGGHYEKKTRPGLIRPAPNGMTTAVVSAAARAWFEARCVS